jgi:class 3 adenylate cyclase
MFVDLANSTPLALRLDPEAMRDVLRAFQNAVTAEIQRFGFVAKLMGDGVLAYFGWPRAHGDDAERAVVVALAATAAVARLQSPTGEQLACRVGIATGMVVVGDLVGEGAAQEHTVVGPTPNLAARLQEAAGPGQVMIAEATRRLLGSGFVVEDIGQRLLKGHTEPTPLFRVLRRAAGEPRFVARVGYDAPLIGRQTELRTLRQAWDRAKSGNSQTVLLIGEAGIGKSRLVQELVENIPDDAATRLIFQCSPLHSDNPFWPVVQQLPSAMPLADRVLNHAGLHDRRQLRRDVVAAITMQLLKPSGPMLLVFEDTQWADRATVEVIRRLAVSEVPMLLLVSSRPENEPPLAEAPNLLRLVVPRLDGSAADALLAAISGDDHLAPRLSSEILARSDGIPLFIEELTRAVTEAVPAGAAVSVPATLRDSLIARLDVSSALRGVAQVASCIGRDFDEEVLSAVADVPPADLRAGLTALLQAGLILAPTAGRFRFKHALVCDIAYESLLTPRRQRLHQRIAEALEAMSSDFGDREPETLAHHWFAAGQKARAEGYWLRAKHRVAHWQEQLDALAEYLEADSGQSISVLGAPGPGKLH